MAERKNEIFEQALSIRKADHEINPIFLKRWSPRAMTGEVIKDSELNSLFEAARWAPSTNNEQEWRFLYESRDGVEWDTFFSLLVEGNQVWCKNASHLVVVLSRKTFIRNGKENPVHIFDSGSAFQNLLLEAASRSLVAHGMSGFDAKSAAEKLEVSDEFSVNVMIALGYPAEKSVFPESYQEKESPSQRKPISEIAMKGKFAFEK